MVHPHIVALLTAKKRLHSSNMSTMRDAIEVYMCLLWYTRAALVGTAMISREDHLFREDN